EDIKVGIIKKEYIDFLKYTYITGILECTSTEGANALVAYAGFLNKNGIDSDNYPLYLRVIDSNVKYAIDKLTEGYTPESYLDCVIPNYYIVQTFFQILKERKRNEMYIISLRIILGFFYKVYKSPEEGYQLYQPSIADVNGLGKFLNKEKNQDDELNRDILDVLLLFSDLEKPHETDQNKLSIARQASRIRSDYFDNTRSLRNSLTDVILETVENPSFGISPEYIYGEES
ncbi:MAG: hypothetical protein AB1798_21415, partial [Spirochaetota bacterium]